MADKTLSSLTSIGTLSSGDTGDIVYVVSGGNSRKAHLGGIADIGVTTDNAIARFNGTDGALQNSGITIDDNDDITGAAGGLTITGGTGSGDDLRLTSTSNATKGTINIGSATSGIFFDEALERISLGANIQTFTFSGIPVGVDFFIHNDEAAEVCQVVGRYSSTALNAACWAGVRSRGTIAVPTVVQSGDRLALFSSFGFDGTDYEYAGAIYCEVDGTPGSNDMPGRWIIATTPDGSTVPVEAVRFRSDQSALFAKHIDLTEIAEPASPAANVARVRALDDGAGVTTVGFKDSAGNVVPMSHFLQSGTGAVTRTQHAKLRERVDARDFGVTGNGSTDDAAAINAGLAALNAAGGGVLEFPAGFNCRITARIDNTYANVLMRGLGPDSFHDVGTQGANAAVKFTWAGATDANDAMVLISSPFGASNPVLTGGGIENIMLDCARIRGIGLQVLSRRQLLVRDIFVLDATNRAFWFTAGITSTDYGEAADIQDGLFERLRWRLIDVAAVQSAHGLYLTGSSNANTSFNTFKNCIGQTQNGTGYFLESADNNVFIGCRHFSLGTGLDFDLKGTTGGGSVGGASNYFIGCSWGAGAGKFTIRGTEAGFAAGTNDNVLVTEDLANSSAEPVLGTGSSVIRPTKAAFLSVKGTPTNTTRYVQDITGTANQVLRVNSAGTALAFGALDLTQAGTATAAWTTYTPTFTSASGTLGTQTLNRARYLQVGKLVHVLVDVSITSAGTAPGGAVRITLPVVAANVAYSGGLSGYELANGNILSGYVDGTNSRANVTLNNGAFPGANGNRLMMTMTYEAA
jgi:hypothetical protein